MYALEIGRTVKIRGKLGILKAKMCPGESCFTLYECNSIVTNFIYGQKNKNRCIMHNLVTMMFIKNNNK